MAAGSTDRATADNAPTFLLRNGWQICSRAVMRLFRLNLLLALFIAGSGSIYGCDLCGCYTPQLEAMSHTAAYSSAPWLAGSYVAIGEQFTSFDKLQLNGREVANPVGQYLNSWITQLVAGYGINDRLAVQLSVPLIYRDFKRPEGFAIDRGNISGLGDMSLVLRSVAFKYAAGGRRTFEVEGKNPVAIEHEPDFTASVVLLTGLKLPTGDTRRLKEEFHEIDIPGAPVSGIHGHDLTLGTGSYDGVFGEQSSLRYQSMFLESAVQFTLRGSGAHQYDFANDLSWSAGPGYYFVRRPDLIVGLQFEVSGEHKDVDRFRGREARDTGITSLFVGPRVVASRGRLSAEVSADFPVSIDNTALQAVPDYRLRGGISVHF